MFNVLFFRDVSNWDGLYNPVGATFAKATQGATFVDKYYARTESLTLAGGWPFAGYHYLDKRSSALAQARHALDVIGKSIPTMWDIERGGGTLPDLIDVHDSYVARGGHGRLVYLPRWYWESIGSPSLRPLIDRGLILVSSNYTPYSNTGPGWEPYGGMTPMIWQFTDKPGDTNAFRGTAPMLAKLLNIRATGAPGAPLPPPPPPLPVGHRVVAGDTLWSIAESWHVTLESVEQANPHAGHPAGNFNLIEPGDWISHP